MGTKKVEIHENNKNHLTDFIRLNEEWITQYFALEKADRTLAANPSIVMDNQGYLFSLVHENKVVGVCALINDGNGVFELARMAVSPPYHGQGFGNTLVEASILKARSIKAKKLYLISNTKLKAAISLYNKYGFVTIQTGQHPVYSRANIIMELIMS